jgi:hypothetical protein
VATPSLTTALASWKASLDLPLHGKESEVDDHSACEEGIFARDHHGSRYGSRHGSYCRMSLGESMLVKGNIVVVKEKALLKDLRVKGYPMQS